MCLQNMFYRTIGAGLMGFILAAGCSDDLSTPREARDTTGLAQTASGQIPAVGQIEALAAFMRQMPTGLAVTRSGQIYVCFPRWGDKVDFAVVDLVDEVAIPYPDAGINQQMPGRTEKAHLISVQSVVTDADDRLWVLDTGSENFSPVHGGGPKLLCIDPQKNSIVKRITFPDSVVLASSYLNDVRIAADRGQEGMAFISDSSDHGPNGIIVVDLASGKSWRRLNDHPSTKADAGFIPNVEGQPLVLRPPGKPELPMTVGIDGVAIDSKRGILYYCALSSHRLNSVNLDALADADLPDDQVARTIKPMPARDFASDGLECDHNGTLYLTDYEHNAIRRLAADGTYPIVASDPHLIWPDSMAFGNDGYLYVISNQLNRQSRFHGGRDRRQPPYVLFRAWIGPQMEMAFNPAAGRLANNNGALAAIRLLQPEMSEFSSVNVPQDAVRPSYFSRLMEQAYHLPIRVCVRD